MDLIRITCEQPLPRSCGCRYKGIAFDGCHYYLTCSDRCEIIKYDLRFCEEETIETRKNYTCICFDPERDCFWAGSLRYPCQIFKLDLCFREIDCIRLPCCEIACGIITAVSFDCKENCLLVCCSNAILRVCPETPKAYSLVKKTGATENLSAVSVAPGYLVVELRDEKQMICVYDCASKLTCKCEVPCGYAVEAIGYNPCAMRGGAWPVFYLLANKSGCYPHLLEFTLPCCQMDICPCNCDICCKICCPPLCPPPCPAPEDVCAELMESIALIEAALSHILNAEGEKLQKIIASTDDVDKILCANESVQEMIVGVTHLEIVLHDKLRAVKACCGICAEENPCPPCCHDEKTKRKG